MDPTTSHDSTPHQMDQELCDDPSWARLQCPAGYTPQKYVGDVVVLDLEDVAQSVCGGRGLFIDTSEVEGVDAAGFQITQNTACTFGCFGTCGAGLNICVTEHADGSPCSRVCSILGVEECVDAAQACDPEACPPQQPKPLSR